MSEREKKKKTSNIREKKFCLLLSVGFEVRVKGLQPKFRVRVLSIGFPDVNRCESKALDSLT